MQCFRRVAAFWAEAVTEVCSKLCAAGERERRERRGIVRRLVCDRSQRHLLLERERMERQRGWVHLASAGRRVGGVRRCGWHLMVLLLRLSLVPLMRARKSTQGGRQRPFHLNIGVLPSPRALAWRL
jgi:hypothetical protein